MLSEKLLGTPSSTRVGENRLIALYALTGEQVQYRVVRRAHDNEFMVTLIPYMGVRQVVHLQAPRGPTTSDPDKIRVVLTPVPRTKQGGFLLLGPRITQQVGRVVELGFYGHGQDSK